MDTEKIDIKHRKGYLFGTASSLFRKIILSGRRIPESCNTQGSELR